MEFRQVGHTVSLVLRVKSVGWYLARHFGGCGAGSRRVRLTVARVVGWRHLLK